MAETFCCGGRKRRDNVGCFIFRMHVVFFAKFLQLLCSSFASKQMRNMWNSKVKM